jgi:hypothetical protein
MKPLKNPFSGSLSHFRNTRKMTDPSPARHTVCVCLSPCENHGCVFMHSTCLPKKPKKYDFAVAVDAIVNHDLLLLLLGNIFIILGILSNSITFIYKMSVLNIQGLG